MSLSKNCSLHHRLTNQSFITKNNQSNDVDKESCRYYDIKDKPNFYDNAQENLQFYKNRQRDDSARTNGCHSVPLISNGVYQGAISMDPSNATDMFNYNTYMSNLTLYNGVQIKEDKLQQKYFDIHMNNLVGKLYKTEGTKCSQDNLRIGALEPLMSFKGFLDEKDERYNSESVSERNTCNFEDVYKNGINNNEVKPLKTVICNKVLDNPWCSKVPLSYRPFRRKLKIVDKVEQTEKGHIEEEQKILSDNNNNIEESLNLNPTRLLTTEHVTRSTDGTDQSLTGVEGMKCTICDQVYASPDSLRAHMKRHASARYKCDQCGKTFSQLRNYKYHMSVHRGTGEFAATCSECGKCFNDRGYLSSHMKIHRNRKEYKCSVCPKSFNQRVAYNMHVRIHTGVKPHVCGTCGKAFSRKMLLTQHARTHSGERPYACPHCARRFADRSNMSLHLRLHTGVKPFSCTLCDKSFTKKHHLKSHLNFHAGVKPYSCPNCRLAFTQSSNMRTHYKKCIATTQNVMATSSSPSQL